MLSVIYRGFRFVLLPFMPLIGMTVANKPLQPHSLTECFTLRADTTFLNRTGYLDITSYGGGFIAVGSNGRIDRIDADWNKRTIPVPVSINLIAVITANNLIYIAGDSGTMLRSSDGENFRMLPTGCTKKLNDLAFFNGLIIAASDSGEIISSVDGEKWSRKRIKVSGNIVSLAANASFCIGVTDKGDILKSSDGIIWNIFDYNKVYAGFNKHCSFTRTAINGNRIAIIGRHDDRSPVLLFSSMGEVWTERPLFFTSDDESAQPLQNQLIDISYDDKADQYLILCDHGMIFTVPSCIKCNRLFKVSEKQLYTLLLQEGDVIIAGENYYYNKIKFVSDNSGENFQSWFLAL